VAGVVASLKSDNVIGRLTKEINDFPLALVSPLGSNHNYIRHGVNLYIFGVSEYGSNGVLEVRFTGFCAFSFS
jgi:hypothetical protein